MKLSSLVLVPTLAGALLAGTGVAADAAPAAAPTSTTVYGLPSVTYLQSLATSYNLDSNSNGNVYAISPNWGGYQKWVVGYGAYGGVTLRDWQTGRCLDSNASRQVYTLWCNGGSYQSWHVEWTSYGTVNLRNIATGFVLDGNGAHAVYTLGANGGSYQKWIPIAAG